MKTVILRFFLELNMLDITYPIVYWTKLNYALTIKYQIAVLTRLFDTQE